MSMAHRLRQQWECSKFVKDASTSLFLQVTARALAVVGTLHAVRCLGPEQLGIGAFVVVAVSQVAVLGDLGLSIAGVRELGNRPGSEAATVTLLSGLRLCAALILSGLFVMGLSFWHPAGGRAPWLAGLPLLFVFVLSPQWIFQGLERIPLFNTVEVIRSILTAGLYLTLFRPGTRAPMYVAVAVAAQGAGWVISYCVLLRYVRLDWRLFHWARAFEVLRGSARAFAVVFTVAIYSGMDIPLATLLLSVRDAGLYRAAQTVAAGMGPLLTIVPLLLYPRLIAWKNVSAEVFARKGAIGAGALAIVALGILITAVAAIPRLLPLILGPSFEPAVTPTLLLIVAKCFVIVATLPVWGLHAYNLDGQYLSVTVGVAVTSLGLNLILTPRLGLIGLGAVNALSELLILCLSAALLFRHMGRSRLVAARALECAGD
jgi:PST family polysaccharide transporter